MPPAPLARALDRATDAVVVAFAIWTLVYHLGLLIRPPSWALLAMWAAASGAAAAVYAWRKRPGGGGALWDDPAVPSWNGIPWQVAAVAVIAGVGAGVAAGLHENGVPWWCTWTLGVLSVAATAYGVLRGRTVPGGPGPDGPGADGPGADGPDGETPARGEGRGDRWGSPVALVTSAGFAVASWFLVNPDGDDAYFVSRSVATATDGRIPFHDVIFTTGTTGPIAGEPPVSSVEVLAGVLARLVGMHPASFLWYVLLPAVTFLAVWALWRLAREWAPRLALACFAVAVVYLLWSGVGQASLGSFHLLRMWQGKAIMVSALIPLLYVHLTRWAERRTGGALVLVAAAGTAAVGLSSSATMVVPLVTGAVAGALIVSGRVRTGLAACAAMLYPLAAGIAVLLLHDDTSVVGPFTDAPTSFSWVLMSGVMGIAGGCALWLAPLLARRGIPALVTAGTAAVTTLLLLPGVLDAIADGTGAAQVMWRTLWLVPAPVLVGLLATAHLRGLPVNAVRVAVPVALCAVMVVAGVPLWSGQNGTSIAHRPSWKTDKHDLATARKVIRTAEARASGRPVVALMPQRYMRQVPLFSTTHHAVNPNSHYLRLLPVQRRFIDDRMLLTTLMEPRAASDPSAAEVRRALRRTGVTIACTRRTDAAPSRLLEAAGFVERTRVGRLTCLFPAAS
ncbi:DUF6077 domain-containing protein [Actinomadura sp. 9N407]|uniref:DUF6077 domain-containing protein n=1 Tax=Actinomadura sp. 9N407 TaxID=3375154 RepID=UPI0037B0F724